jgi:hypothetical protein
MNPAAYIPLTQCVKGKIYRLNSRNLEIGVYDGKEGFIGIREKFGRFYLFTEYHHDQGPSVGTVYPLEVIGELPATIAVNDREIHAWGDGWFWDMELEIWKPIARRDLKEGEAQHGTRQGFVDEFAGTNTRLGDNQWPCLRRNEALFDYLKTLEALGE